MASVSVNAPKTPVTKGSSGIATATVPNVCKMPGPPAPFVPTPLPNIGQSGKSPDGYSTTVKIEGNAVAIRGASFGSSGDVASKGTGGGIVSSNVEGPTKFIGPGSLNVQIEGKNVHLLGDPMMNNCGPGGSPANAATLTGLLQAPEPMLAPDAPCGGPHSQTSTPTNDGYDSHHTPAKDTYKHTALDKKDGPAIKMDPADHKMTASFGSGDEAKAYRAKQKDLIDQGKFAEARQMDIEDIKSKFPGKYDHCLEEMETYASTLEALTAA